MANLLGQNIGTNYKGILNLDSTINTPLDATLRAVTDGEGNASPLKLSTTKIDNGTFVTYGGTTNAFPAIKRNGAAIYFRLADDSAFASINANTGTFVGNLEIGGGSTFFGNNFQSTNYNAPFFWDGFTSFVLNTNPFTNISGTVNSFIQTSSFVAAAGSANYRSLSLNYTINNSGAQSGTATGIFLNATETALNGMAHNLLDLQVGGVSKFRVSRNGDSFAFGTLAVGSIVANDNSVQLQVDSTTRGFLPPRMTTTQKNAIATPAAGLVVYDTTLGKLCVRTASAWERITSV